ncbi:MAG: hypothetical protein LBP62_00960 [Clostridiales bacterium]|jgi:hypothetical protein|nr:hypothetical protein [Clostridiales bacterium]
MGNLQKKKLSRLLICLVLIMSLFLLVSCGDKTDGGETPDDSTWTSLLENGSFKEYSGTDMPYSPNGWTGSFGSTDSNYYDSVIKEAVKAGVINTDPAEYAIAKNRFLTDVPNPGTNKAEGSSPDPYVLMIYNGGGGAYYFSKSFTTSANKYYSLSIDVRTQEAFGASIRLRGSAWYDSGIINTDKQWKTYTFYFEAHQASSKSITIQLWNGIENGSFFNAVFFDNVKISEMKRSEYLAKQSADSKNAFSLRLPNPDFNASSYAYSDSPVSLNDYSTSPGTSKDASKSPAQGGSQRISYGMVSKDYTNASLSKTAAANVLNPTSEFPNADGFLLMLWNKDYTAYGYKSNSSSGIVLERGQYYKISVNVLTDGLTSMKYNDVLYGNYYKNTNGVYTKIASSADFLGSDGKPAGETNTAVKSNGWLGVRANLPTKTNATITRYLNVIDNYGNLMIEGGESVTAQEKAARQIIATLWSLKNNSPSTENNENIFITLESAICWLEAAYNETAANGAPNETYNPYDSDGNPRWHKLEEIKDGDGNVIGHKPVYTEKDANGNTVSLWKDSEEGSVGYALAALLLDPDIDGKEAFDKVAVKDADGNAVKNEDGSDKFEFTANGDFATTYLQFKTYIRAFDNFESDREGTNLSFTTDHRYYTTTSFKYGMTRYAQGDSTPVEKGSNADGTLLGGNLSLKTSSISIDIKGIVTDGEWQTFDFYVRANQFQNTTFDIYYNLGEGGAEDADTHIKGFMFVDSLSITAADSPDEIDGFDVNGGYDAKIKDKDGIKITNGLDESGHANPFVTADVSSETADNLIQNWAFSDEIAWSDTALETGSWKDGRWVVEQPDEIDKEGKGSSYIHVGYGDTGYLFGAVDAGENGLPYVMQDDGGKSFGKILSLVANQYGIFQIRPLYVGETPDGSDVLSEKFGAIQIAPLTYYRLSVWIKTADIPETSDAAVNVYLAGYTENKENDGLYRHSDGLSYDRNELASVTGVKTPEPEEGADSEYNGYTEVVFYIGGNRTYQDFRYVDLEITFGSGDYMSTKTLAKGSVSVAYPSLYKIAYKEYKDASSSGSYTKKYDFPTAAIPSENTFTNGEFDSIDIENTELNDKGLIETPYIPSSWTFQEGKNGSNAALTKYDVISGNIDLDNAYMIAKLAENYGIFGDVIFGDDSESNWLLNDITIEANKKKIIKAAYEAVYGENKAKRPELTASNSLLMLSNAAKDSGGTFGKTQASYGYKSTSSKSLSSNKYYRVSVMAMSLEGSPDAHIYLTSSSASPSMIYGENETKKTEYKLSNIGKDWKEYIFYIEVGQSSVSVNLEFWLGDKDKKTPTEGIVLIDNVRVAEIPETQTIGTKDYLASGCFEAVLDKINGGAGVYGDGYSMFDLSKPITLEGAWAANNLINDNKPTYTQEFIALTYMTDGFDSYGENKSAYVTSNEGKEEDEKQFLYSPSGWSGSLLKGSSSEVVAGVIDFTTNIENVLKKNSEDGTVTNGLDGDPRSLFGDMGDRMLVIWNNSDELAYTYTSSSKTLSSKSIYEISVYVKTLDLANDKNAVVHLTLGTTNLTFNVNSARISNAVSGYEGYTVDEKTVFDQNIIEKDSAKSDKGVLNGYTKLTFYVNNQMKSTSISSVGLIFGLGDAENGLKGLVGIDNFSIKKFAGTEEDFDKLKADYEAAYAAGNKTVDTSDDNKRQFDTVVFMSVPNDEVINPKPAEPEPPKNPPNMQWLIISSAVVGGATVVIILIYFYQRKKTAVARFINEKIFKGKLTLYKANKSRLRGVSPSVKEIRNEYDKYKED